MSLDVQPYSEFTLNHPPSQSETRIQLTPILIRESENQQMRIEEQEEEDWLGNYGCICTERKIFCQNLRINDLTFLPKDVEFL